MSLVSAWVSAVTDLGGDPVRAELSGRDALARYAEAHRRYHGLRHVEQVLSDVDHLAIEVGLAADAQAVVALAGVAHDVIYDGRPGADERASADWAVSALTAAGVQPAPTAEVTRLILLTTTHDPARDDEAGSVLCDADLAVLGGDAASYEWYRAAVRQDYAHVTDEQWRAGRAAVLQDLLAHHRLFRTEPGFHRWEASARMNLTAELNQLTRTD